MRTAICTSLVAGAAAAFLTSRSTGFPQHPIAYQVPQVIEIRGVPAPEDMVQIMSEVDVGMGQNVSIPPQAALVLFQVPQDKWLVITWCRISPVAGGPLRLFELHEGVETLRYPGPLMENGDGPDGAPVAFGPGSSLLFRNLSTSSSVSFRYDLLGYFVDAK